MPFSTFLSTGLEYVEFHQIFNLLCTAATVGIVSVCVRYVLFRRKYSELLPSRKVRWFNILGNVIDFPWTEQARNGFSFNVFSIQVLSGHNSLHPKAQLHCTWASYAPFIIFKKAEAVEALISGTKHMKKSWSYNWLHSWLGTGLLTSYGPKWKSRRKLLNPSFHFEILKDFLPVFNEQSQVLVKHLQKETTKDSTDIATPITLCSLDIICGEIIMERMVNCWYWIDFLFNLMEAGKELKFHLKVLHDFTLSVIDEKKKKLLSRDPEIGTKNKRKALMDVLLEHHLQTKDLTEEDIREEVDTFAFEGHDTTSVGISWALYLIGLHKNVQGKIHEELDGIFGDDVERPVDTKDLQDMHYLECVLKESQRLFPSVPLIAREMTQDTNICGYPIPKGSTCGVFVYILHRDETVFPNPEKFDPDRFLPENCLNRHPFAYIPFSAGPRNCIGQRFAMMEEKVLVSAILRNFTLESLDPRDKLPPASELVLRSSRPIRIRIRPRQKLHT